MGWGEGIFKKSLLQVEYGYFLEAPISESKFMVCTCCSVQDEMNLKVLKFQNKKLGERLEELKVEEEKLKDQVDELKKQRESDLNIISVINRHWMQVFFVVVVVLLCALVIN